MAGEITKIQTSDGVDHLIDYQSLANKPDIAGLTSRVAALETSVANIVAALEEAGIYLGGATVSDGKLSLAGASVAGSTLSLSGATVSGSKLTI